ncbi:Golgi complex component 7-domain-containing protein [Hyaloraphidium curvatum]|nr:Golgi complex component 7-domain-containing protein [Hyaloraphidium curvatum]
MATPSPIRTLPAKLSVAVNAVSSPATAGADTVAKFAAFAAPDWSVQEWVNRELAAAKPVEWAGEKGGGVADIGGSAVSQQELDGFATTVLEEEGARDARKESPLSAPAGQLTSEQLASALVTKLQSIASEISAAIDKVCEDSLKNVPRVLYDLDAVRTEAGAIKDTLKKAQRTFDSPAYADVGRGPSQAIVANGSHVPDAALANGSLPSPVSPQVAPQQSAFASLVSLDTVLSRMLQSLAALQETEHWTTLGPEMDSIFASGDLDRAATRLLEAQRSLSLLESTAGYEERKQLLTDLCDRLETEVVPKLVDAIEKRDIDVTKKMKGVLARMGRAGELFGRHYSAARKQALVEMWKGWSAGTVELDVFLIEFYDAVLTMVNKELSWASGLFGDVVGAMHDLLGQVFGSLEPEPGARLGEFLTKEGAAALPTLVHIYTVTAGFSLTMESQLSGFSESWSLPLLQPFLSHQSNYGTLEQRYLLSLLEDPKREYFVGLKAPPFSRDVSSSMEAYAETVQKVADSVVPFAFQAAEAAVHRCEQFTYGFADVALLESLDLLFQKLVRDGIGSVLAGVRRAAGMEPPVGGGPRPKLAMADGGEWEVFQLGLKILVVCANLDRRFAEFEHGVVRPTLKKAAHLLELVDVDAETEPESGTPVSKGEPKGQGKSPLATAVANSLATPSSKATFDAVPQAALSLLRRSALNSPQLRVLLTDPPAKLVDPPLEQLTRSAHRLVFDASFMPIEREFETFASLPWSANEASPVAGSRRGMMELPQFSLNPSPYITRIGEHLLTLPQQMELYQDDEGLCYRAELLPHLELLKPAAEAESAPTDPDAGGEPTTPVQEDPLALPPAALYLTALALGTQQLLVKSVVALPALSDKGARQLSADAGYLANVVSALDVEVLPTVKAIEDMCGCPAAEAGKKLEAKMAEGCGREEEDLRRRLLGLRTGAASPIRG